MLLTHEEPPDNLKKKATLLWYFEGYLKGSSFRARSDKHPGRVSGECVGPGIPGDGAVDASRDDVTGGTYVKKWLKTKHAIIFRLSNKVIQVTTGLIVCVFETAGRLIIETHNKRLAARSTSMMARRLCSAVKCRV